MGEQTDADQEPAGLRARIASLEETVAWERAARSESEQIAIYAERRRISQMLHDSTCQSLTGIYLNATVTARKFQSMCPDAARELMQLSAQIHKATGELHEIVNSLRSPEQDTP